MSEPLSVVRGGGGPLVFYAEIQRPVIFQTHDSHAGVSSGYGCGGGYFCDIFVIFL